MNQPTAPSDNHPLWDYSVAVYDAAGVAPLCLRLQDDFGLDVNLLLYAAWCAHDGETLTQQHLRQVERATTQWRLWVVRPLRALRRGLRGIAVAGNARARLRALELLAERRQQDIIYRVHREAGGLPLGDNSLLANLTLVAGGVAGVDGDLTGQLRELADMIAVSARG